MAEDSRSTSRQPSRCGAGTPSTSQRPAPSASIRVEVNPAADRPWIRALRVAPVPSRSMTYSTAQVLPSSMAVAHPSMRHPPPRDWKYATSKPVRASRCCHAAVAGTGANSIDPILPPGWGRQGNRAFVRANHFDFPERRRVTAVGYGRPGFTAQAPAPGCCDRRRSATGRPASRKPRSRSPCPRPQPRSGHRTGCPTRRRRSRRPGRRSGS